jgi:hypothetical protein
MSVSNQQAAYSDIPLSIVLRVFLPFAGGYFLSYLYRTVNAVISPELVTSLNLSAADLRLLTSVYFLTFALFQLPLAIVLEFADFALPLWILFGFFGTTGILSYAVLSQAFPAALAGRVNTAVNLLVFIAAFTGQWGIGAVISLWPASARGYHPQGYQAAFALVLALETLAFAWFLYPVGSPFNKKI